MRLPINQINEKNKMPTVYELLDKIRKATPRSIMFSKKQMYTQGESIKTMMVMKHTQKFRGHDCYVLRSLRKQPRTNLRYYVYYYFDEVTYEYIGHDCNHATLLSRI